MRLLFIISIFFCASSFGQTVNDLRPTVTMKEYVDMQAQLNREWMSKFIDAQIQTINDNVVRANIANEKRFDGVNEFRAQLKDQAGTFVTRNELWTGILGVIGVFFGLMTFLQRRKESGSGGSKITGEIEVNKRA